MQDQSLSREDPLEKEMATHSSILAWRILMGRRAWQATVHGVAKSDTTEVTQHTHTHTHGDQNKVFTQLYLWFCRQ